jgi:hypothetical protein
MRWLLLPFTPLIAVGVVVYFTLRPAKWGNCM